MNVLTTYRQVQITSLSQNAVLIRATDRRTVAATDAVGVSAFTFSTSGAVVVRHAARVATADRAHGDVHRQRHAASGDGRDADLNASARDAAANVGIATTVVAAERRRSA